jgi:Domain of unknown function (DUF1995)
MMTPLAFAPALPACWPRPRLSGARRARAAPLVPPPRLTASASPPPSSSSASSSSRAPGNSANDHTPSGAELLRKYRTTPLRPEELELVGWPPTDPKHVRSPADTTARAEPLNHGPAVDVGGGNGADSNRGLRAGRGRGGGSSSSSSGGGRRRRAAAQTVTVGTDGSSSGSSAALSAPAAADGRPQGRSVHTTSDGRGGSSSRATSSASSAALNSSMGTANIHRTHGQDANKRQRGQVRSEFGDARRGGGVEHAELVGGTPATHSPRRSSTVLASSTSRFPSTWSSIVRQAGDATFEALQSGHDRLIVSVKNPGVLPRGDVNLTDDPCPSVRSRLNSVAPMAVSFALTLDICNTLIARLHSGDGISENSYVTPNARINLIFNTQAEADTAIPLVVTSPSIAQQVRFQVLSSSPPLTRDPLDICIMAAPTNQRDNLTHIEAVERVHYGSWNDMNIIIMVNPDLAAITSFPALDGEVRSPGFLVDYLQAFVLDPAIFRSKNITGAILRCFPRKWETYILRAAAASSFRLVGESESRPLPEKILYDFSWRASKESPLEVD